MDQPTHFFDRYELFLNGSARDAARLHYRYEAIIAQNFELFPNTRVLDIVSGDGCWSMAALDAGANHVVGIEPVPEAVQAARDLFQEYGVGADACQFIYSEIFSALRSMKPEAFDLIICQNCCEQADLRVLFSYFDRLRPKHVILDTTIARGEGPVTRFALKMGDPSAAKATRDYAEILAIPNHEMINLLCEYFKFRWRLIEWQAMGIVDWTGIRDYQRDRRRTYVLDRL